MNIQELVIEDNKQSGKVKPNFSYDITKSTSELIEIEKDNMMDIDISPQTPVDQNTNNNAVHQLPTRKETQKDPPTNCELHKNITRNCNSKKITQKKDPESFSNQVAFPVTTNVVNNKQDNKILEKRTEKQHGKLQEKQQ
ncbi:hypothetical protein HI914_03350 [Erysiphe necator]|nr:hypothetical protein HI914_03350 [Erysiphe necator]